MQDTSASRLNTLFAHEKRERAFAVGILVVANVVVTLGVFLHLYLLFPISRPPGWVISAVWGFLFGEVAWVAFWFSLSGSTFRFRTCLVIAALALFSFGHNFLIRYCVVLSMRWGTPLIDASFSWSDSLTQFTHEFNASLCFILLVYAVLLPVRHFFGITVATVDPSKEAGHGRGQFQIQHWMIWAAAVAAPLALTSMGDIRRGDGGVPSLVIRLVISTASFLLALPVFLASLQQRRAAAWTGLTLAGLAILGFVGCEVVRISQPILDWRASITFLAVSSTVIGCNNIVLRFLGLRLRRVPQGKTNAT